MINKIEPPGRSARSVGQEAVRRLQGSPRLFETPKQNNTKKGSSQLDKGVYEEEHQHWHDDEHRQTHSCRGRPPQPSSGPRCTEHCKGLHEEGP